MKKIAFCVIVGSLLSPTLWAAPEQPDTHKIQIIPLGHATPEEVIAKVRAAAEVLKTDADLAQFNEIEGNPWVWKDTYIFVYNCEADKMSAHPIKESLIGKPIMSLRDYAGNLFFEEMCRAALEPDGGWVKYSWPKPGDTEGSPKFSYNLQAQDSKYQVGAGIYGDNTTVETLNVLLSK
ncbi:MAG: cache domain-containing protein [Thiotrichaceae bacterium]|nr:cache domain-containing protein [Thiotrichaceae bacterium]